MLSLSLLFALIVTILPAWVWLQKIVPYGAGPRHLLIGGYAIFLGMIGVSIIMRVLSYFGIPFSFGAIVACSVLLMIAGFFQPKRWQSTAIRHMPAMPLSRLQVFVVIVCLLLILVRLVTLTIEVSIKPVQAWDALQHWTKQAKVFYEQQAIPDYVTLSEWLKLQGSGVYTNMHPDYPITGPLLQTWTNVALGRWHDSLMNLPWLLVWCSLGLIFYSQSRIANVDPVTAIAATYMMLSLPMLTTHVALPGYPDVILALSFLASFCAFYNWSQNREHWQAALFCVCAASGVLIKNEGVFWFLTFFPGIILVLLGFRRGMIALVLLFFVLIVLFLLIPGDWTFAGHSLDGLELGYRPAGLQSIYQNFLVFDNWHFLSYLLIAALLVIPLQLRALAPVVMPITVVMISSFALYSFLYLGTSYSFGAVQMSSLNRVALHLMPAVAFFVLLVFANLSAVQSRSSRSTTAAQSLSS